MKRGSSHRDHENRRYESSPHQGPSRGRRGSFSVFLKPAGDLSAAGAPRRGRRGSSHMIEKVRYPEIRPSQCAPPVGAGLAQGGFIITMKRGFLRSTKNVAGLSGKPALTSKKNHSTGGNHRTSPSLQHLRIRKGFSYLPGNHRTFTPFPPWEW